jgi:hypothetical protein
VTISSPLVAIAIGVLNGGRKSADIRPERRPLASRNATVGRSRLTVPLIGGRVPTKVGCGRRVAQRSKLNHRWPGSSVLTGPS